MAKLHAFGQSIIVTISREAGIPADRRSPYGPDWERTMYAMVDNGRLLKKRSIRWPDGQYHGGDWKVAVPAGRSAMTQSPDGRGIRINTEAAARWILNRETEGWEMVPGDAYSIVREAVDRERKSRQVAAAVAVNSCGMGM